MFHELISINSETNVTNLPDVFNSNNQAITDEFNYIYDSSNNYLRQSLVSEKGKVYAHWGRFVNLRCKNLIVEDGINGNNLFDSSVIAHDTLSDRFSWDLQTPPSLEVEDLTKFAHDSNMIVTWADEDSPITIGNVTYTSPITLRQELNGIEKLVGDLAKNISIKKGNDEVAEDLLVGLDDDEILDGILSPIDSYENSYVSDSEISAKLDDILSKLENMESRLTVLENK